MLSLRVRRTLFATAVTVVLVGCSLIVPSEVPAYRCTGEDPSSCPSGTVCDTASLTCVSPSALPEAGADDDDDDAAGDASPDRDGPSGPSPIGGDCVVDGDCAAGLLCGTSTILTTQIVPANSKPICTKPCCASTDCPSGFVCHAAATGGNYCVSAARADRTLPPSGGKAVGQTCASPSECRYGLCTGRCQNDGSKFCDKAEDCGGGECMNRRCSDSCCEASQCTSGSTCRVMTVATHIVWACGTANAGGKELDASCVQNSECRNDNCVFGTFPAKRCTPPCCSSSDCTALGFTNNVCAYGSNGNDRIKWCFEPNSAGAAIGATCSSDTDCLSRYCDSELRKCLNVCCTDSDCANDETCRPSPVGTPYLRCVKDR
ncbi:MAG: hypothetical protein KF764_23280 [Labilithrix sp.]|nr:hypothetical protein [Labilithrix sp.]